MSGARMQERRYQEKGRDSFTEQGLCQERMREGDSNQVIADEKRMKSSNKDP